MPQIKVRGIKLDSTIKISEALVDELQELLQCPRSYFTVEHIASVFISSGKACDGYPFVEVAWFDRGQEVQDKAAQIITKHVQDCGYENVDVYFTPLKTTSYYENGTHF